MTPPITTTELAVKLGVSPQRVRKWVADGRIKPALTLPNGNHLFSRATRKPKDRKPGRPAQE